MEQLSIRSLRHIRQIRADLRQMTQSMTAIKARSMRAGSGVDVGGTGSGVVIRPSGHTRCPDEFVGVGRWRTCYRFSNFDASWHEAREYCSAFGANLVSLDSMKEAYIIDYLIKSHPGSNHAPLSSLTFAFFFHHLEIFAFDAIALKTFTLKKNRQTASLVYRNNEIEQTKKID